jgi:AmmeMemoRadiSam system protein B/AmmeMemoRadiSam system protein A
VPSVRAAAVAGTFYPGDPEKLRAAVSAYLALADPPEILGDIIALMVPHAGYEYSGLAAARAFKALDGCQYDTVVLIGPSHQQMVPGGAAVSGVDYWETPLGQIPVDTQLREQLLVLGDTVYVADGPHAYEHCLEVELPFLQSVLGDFAILPLVMTDFSDQNTTTLAQLLVRAIGDRDVLMVASTDMSHYPAAQEAARVDGEMLTTIARLEPAQVYQADERLMAEGVPDLHCTLCGLGPLVVAMKAARMLGADRVEGVTYSNSAEVEPATSDRCVGYGTAVFVGERQAAAAREDADEPEAVEPGELIEAQRQFLLTLARDTIREHLTSGDAPAAVSDDAAMQQQRAVFVTLHKRGQLRGCIGQIIARQKLIEAVRDAAISAATEDPRFRAVTIDELDDIDIEISVLSPMVIVSDPAEIEVGTHGVMVVQGSRRGVFLPQVAPEQGWDRETMLTELCAHKAGLAPDAWQHDATLYVFTAQVFGEHDPE